MPIPEDLQFWIDQMSPAMQADLLVVICATRGLAEHWPEVAREFGAPAESEASRLRELDRLRP
jgi:hypothetical protein